jgi:hypothetical protein
MQKEIFNEVETLRISVERCSKRRETMKKLRLAIVTLVILALAVPASMLSQDSKAEQDVRAVFVEILKDNQIRGAEAAAHFGKYMADDYMRITPSGAVFTKAEMLESDKTGATQYEWVETSDVKIRVYGQTAVITGRTRAKGTTVGVPTGPGSRFTRVLLKRDDSWQTVLYQTTRIATTEQITRPSDVDTLGYDEQGRCFAACS